MNGSITDIIPIVVRSGGECIHIKSVGSKNKFVVSFDCGGWTSVRSKYSNKFVSGFRSDFHLTDVKWHINICATELCWNSAPRQLHNEEQYLYIFIMVKH